MAERERERLLDCVQRLNELKTADLSSLTFTVLDGYFDRTVSTEGIF